MKQYIFKFIGKSGIVKYAKITNTFDYRYVINLYNLKKATVFISDDKVFNTWEESKKESEIYYNYGDIIDKKVALVKKEVIYSIG